MKMESLQDLYVEELKDLWSAERQILSALPKMIRAASNRELQRALTQHQGVTERQVQRLERIFRDLGESPRGKKCHGMEGLLEEGKELLENKADIEPEVLDAGLISAAQRVEHYEIAGYGTVRTYAMELGLTEHARVLQEIANEEGEADKLLTRIAESSVNIDAEMAGDEDEGGSRGGRGGSRGGRGGSRGGGRGRTSGGRGGSSGRGGAAKKGGSRRGGASKKRRSR